MIKAGYRYNWKATNNLSSWIERLVKKIEQDEELMSGAQLGDGYIIEVPMKTIEQFKLFHARLSSRHGDQQFRDDVVSI